MRKMSEQNKQFVHFGNLGQQYNCVFVFKTTFLNGNCVLRRDQDFLGLP